MVDGLTTRLDDVALNILLLREIVRLTYIYSNMARTWTPTFEWYVVRCGPKNAR